MTSAASRKTFDARSILRSSRPLRRGLLLSSALVPVLALSFMMAPPAFANGGSSGTGASGGTDSATTVGQDGSSGTGGGGGGAGATGGAGGAAGTAAGGAGGATAGASGGRGQDDTGSGSGGGGGGAHGYVGSVLPMDSLIKGGDGGDSGSDMNDGHASGGGGAGGWGAVITGSGPYDWSATSVTIQGGNGGDAGDSNGNRGAGGSGGIGLYFTSDVSVNMGTGVNIIGGNAGLGSGWVDAGAGLVFDGSATGTIAGYVSGGSTEILYSGYGGVGISVAGDATLTLASTATVTGGLASDGVSVANAIEFAGTTNILTLAGNGNASGSTYATISGDVIGSTAASATNTLTLAGVGGRFDLAQIDVGSGSLESVVFQNFKYFTVDASETWAVTGTARGAGSSNLTEWSVLGGTLQIGTADNAGAIPGNVTVYSGGTLTSTAQVGDVVGSIVVEAGGHLTVSRPMGGAPALETLEGNLTLKSGSYLDVTLSSPSTTDPLIVVNAVGAPGGGTVTLGGTLNITDSGSMTAGTYLLISYTNSVSGTIAIGTAPSDYDYTVDTSSVSGQVLLTVAAGGGLYWNGTTTSGSGPLVGGDGTWTASSGVLNWSNADGTTHVASDAAKAAIFSGTAGTVTIDASSGAVGAKGLKFLTSGYEITGATLTLANGSAAPTVEVDGAGTIATISSVLAGSDGLEKTGDGTLILTGANTYTGGTTITGGVLQIGDGGATGSIDGAIANDVALVVNLTGDLTLSGIISGAGTLEKQGSGTLTLTAANTYSGGTTISAGTLRIGDGTAAAGEIAGNITNNAALVFDRSGALTYAGNISGTGTLTNQGGGTLTLSGALSYTGATTIASGSTLELTSTGTYTLSSAVSNEGSLVVDNVGGARIYISDVISGTGTLTKSGGTGSLVAGLVLTGNNTFTGGTTINANGIDVGNNTTTGDIGDVTFTAANTFLAFYRSNDYTYDSVVSGAGSVVKGGAGTTTFTGENTYTGGTRVALGTLIVGDGATNGWIVGDVQILSGATLVFDRSDAKTFSGSIFDAGSLEKQGAGTLTLSGVNTYTGGTAITAGTLQIGDSGSLGGGAYSEDISIASGATFSYASQSSQVLSGTISGAGALTMSGDRLTLSGANSYDGLTDIQSGSVVVTTDTALGSTTGGTQVASGAQLKLWAPTGVAGLTLGAEALSIGGFGPDYYGALVNAAGLNTYAGAVTLTSDTWIGIVDGSLALTGGITGSGQNLRVWSDSTQENEIAAITTGSGSVEVSSGTWVFTGENTYTGGTTLYGVLSIGNGGTTGSVVGDIANNGILIFNRSDDLAYAGVISGSGTMVKTGAGTLTLTGDNSTNFVGQTTVLGGVLQIGDGGTSGSIGDVDTSSGLTTGALVFNRSDDISYSGVISGSGTLEKKGSGTMILGSSNTGLTGLTTVSEGTLDLTGSVGGGVLVKSGATLIGGGVAIGTVSVEDGATLSVVSGIGFTVGAVDFGATSTFAFSAGAPTSNNAIYSNGDVTLDGTLDLTAGTGFASGTYRLIDYAGSLTDNTMEIGTAPEHSLYAVDTSTTGQVNLIVAAGQWWNGSNTTGGAGVDGGTGTWDVAAGTTNWTSADGSAADAWGQGGLAIFGGTAGTVTIAGSTTPTVAGIEFLTSGYVVDGATPTTALQLVSFASGAIPAISVAEGTATINSVLAGGVGFEKTGEGTLVLSQSNTIEGVVAVSAGTLQFSGAASVAGSIVVKSGASFVAEFGATGGSVLGMTLESGATLQMEADGVSHLTVGGLLLQSGSVINLGLGAPSTTAALSTGNGDLVLSGTLNLTQRDGAGSGTYRLFDYGGQLTNSGLVLGTTTQYSLAALDYSTSGQVNLLIAAAQWWNGSTVVPGTSVQGGDGTWTVTSSDMNWTDSAGAMANAWSQGSIAIFAGTAGTVTLSGATDPEVAGMYFLTSGYAITDGAISLVGFNGQAPVITVGDATPATAGYTASIDSDLSGSAGLVKAGAGTLTLTGNNTITGDTVVSAGSLVFAGGTSTAQNFYVGRDVDTSASVTLTGATTSLDLGTSSLRVGHDGTGSFTISDGATLNSSSGYIGRYSGSVGHVVVTGAGSHWTLSSNLYVGNDGTGTLEISGGASVTATYARIGYYDEGDGAYGSLTITGAGSSLNLGTGELDVGYYNNGSVTVSNGATLTTGIAYIGVYGGYYGPYSGTVTVTGAGSTWNLNGQDLNLGYEYDGSTGTLIVADGGKVESGAVYLGEYDITYGFITVTGAGSKLDAGSNDFYVGYYGEGTVTVSDGGTILSGDLYIGNEAERNSIVTVTGAGSSFDIGTHSIYMGEYGSNATLTVANGGAVTAAQIVKDITADSALIALDGGILRASADQADFLSGFAQGDITLAAAGGGTIDSNGFEIGVGSVLAGAGGLTKEGLGTLTLTGDNTYTGGTTVAAGTLQIGDGGVTGSVLGAIANSATVAYNRSDDVVAGGAITGSGALVQKGAGKLTLVGANSAGAGTTVEAGTLEILSGVSLTSNVTVKSGATLQGETSGLSGAAIDGAVSVENGGTLAAAPVTTAGAYGLSMTSLTLAESANIDVTLGSNTGNAVFSAGTLALDGVLNVTDGGSMALGVYRILDYTTLASDDGLVLGTTPLQYAYEIQQAQGQVNLEVFEGGILYWNGSQTTPDGTIHGGDGTWTASSTDTNWTTFKANQARAWDASFAVFSATAGVVTIDDTAGAVAVSGVQFMVDGYEVTGDALTLAAASGQTQIRVGDGTGAGAAYVATISSVITGSTGLEKTDLGTLILAGTNTYTGGTTITQGTLQIGNGGSTGSIEGDVVNNAALVFNRSDDVSYSGAISGTGSVTKQGAGTLLLGGVNNFSGGLTVSEGAVQVTAASALGSGGLTLEGDGALRASESFSYGGAVTLSPVDGAGGGTFTVDDAKTLTLTGGIGGTGALTKSGTGTLAIGGNTYSGATNVAAGVLEISGGASLSNTARLTVATGATLTLTDANETVGSLAGGGDVALGAYCLITGGDGTSSTFSGALSGTGCLSKTGEGTLTLTGTNNHSGGTTISGGTVQVSAAAALGSGPLALEGPGTLRASDTFTYAGAVSLTPVAGVGGGTFEVDDSKTLTLTGAITGIGNLAKTGTGTLIISGSNSASGATSVDEGTLIAEGGQALGDASAVSVAAGAELILRPSGATETVGSIAGSGALVLDGANLATGADNSSTSFAGIISGTGGLTKTGTGTLTLAGANTYTGDTTVSGGGLAVTGSVDGDIYVENLATLSGTGSVTKTVHVLDGGTLAGGPGAGLTMGGLDLAAAANVSVSLGTPSDDTVFTVNGDVTLDGTLKVTQTAGFGVGVYRIINYTGTLTDNGMEVSPLTGGLLGGVQTSIANQVNLLVEGVDTPILFWNGANTTATQTVLGGTGTWTAGSQTNWINASGTIPQSWNGAFAVFQGSPGTVTVDNTDGQVSATGLQFVETGYVVSGGDLLLAGEAPVIRVGDGTEAGASSVATIASVLTGSNGLEKADYGTLILTGDNLYTGGTLISGGILQIGDGGVSGSILGDVVNNGVLAFDRSDDVTMAGAISGSGALVQAGSGTLYLTGVNTSTGGTTITGGTLRVDAASALGSGGLSVTDQGTLRASGSFSYGAAIVLAGTASTAGTIEVDSAQALTLSGAISGTAGLTKTGDGLLILTGTNSYTGVTTIAAGTLQIGDGGTTGSIAGDVVNNASLVFNRSDTYAFTGAITGSGEVTFTGGGTVLFSAPYTGAVTVDESMVQLASGSSTASTFTVNEGGVLGGTASIGGLVVNEGGIVGPGYSPGTLTVNGPVTFNAGAVYQVDVTAAGAHDLIIASGAVTLSAQARVEVLASAGRYPSTSQITILSTTSTLTGTFGSVTSNYAFLAPELSYDAQNVYLTLVYNGFEFVDYAHTPNQANVAVAAQALGTGNAVYEALFALSEAAVAPALDQLSGEAYASAQTVIQQQSIYLRDAVGTRLRQSLTAPSAGALSYAAKAAGPATAQLAEGFTPTLWAEGFGGWGEVSGNGNAASVSTTVGGVFGGIDAAVLENLRVGLIGGYSRTSFDIDGRSSQGSMDNYDIGLYAGAQFDALALRGGASYTWHDISMSRSVVFPGYYGAQDADYTLGTTQLFGEIGYDMSVGPYAFEPFAGLAYVHVSGNSFTEEGTLASALSVDGAAQDTFYATLGVRVATTLTVAGRTLTPSATLGWQHAFGDTSSTAEMLFANGGANPFTIQGVPVAQDVALVGLGLGYQLSDSAELQLNYAGQLADQTSQNTFSAQFSLKF